MIVEDQLDCGLPWIGGVEQLEEFDEFAASVAILDQSVDLAGDEIDPGQQTDRAVPLVFMLAGKGRVHAGLRRQIGGGRGDRLDAWLLVVRDDRHSRLAFRDGHRLFQEFHLAINAQHLRHFFRKVGVAALQIVTDFVRLHVFLVEDFADRALHQIGEAHMSLRRPMLAGMECEKPRRPQFVRIAEVLRLATGQINQPCLASIVMVGSRPGRGRSSSAAIGPSATARSTQRWTVW